MPERIKIIVHKYLYRQTGQLEQAHAKLSTAIDMYRDMEMTFWLPETEAALAEVEGR
jgi:hypothetical protein